MKQFLRIVIVVLLLIGLGFGTYALFFKPANKDEVYLTLSKVAPLDEQYEFDSMLSKVAGFNNADHTEVINTYVDMFSGDEYTTDAGVTLYSYENIREYMHDVFNYYYAYSQVVTKIVPKSKLTAIKNTVNSYESSFANLMSGGFNEVYKLQTHITDNGGVYETELEGRYRQLILLYRNYLSKFADLINVTKSFVKEYVFAGDMIEDKDTVADELAIKSFAKALSVEYNFSNTTLADDYMLSAKIFKKYATEDSNQKTLVVSYNNVVKVDPSQIDALIGLTTANKKNFDAVKTSFIEVLYEDLENILTICGFGQGGNV